MLNNTVFYPRVLLITRNDVDEFGPKGASIGNWFQFWPKDKIGILCSSKTTGYNYTPHYYVTSDRDITWSALYKRLKKHKPDEEMNNSAGLISSGDVSGGTSCASGDSRDEERPGLLKRIGLAYYRRIFKPVISSRMKAFIDTFKPDIIISFIEDLQAIGWTTRIMKHWDVPCIVELEDNWFALNERASGFGKTAQLHVWKKLQSLLGRADYTFVIGHALQKHLKKTCNIDSEALHCVDLPSRYDTWPKRPIHSDTRIIRYCGSVGSRIDTICDLYDAVQSLREEDPLKIEVHIHGVIPESYRSRLKASWFFQHPIPPHDEVPKLLRNSNILFLSETYQQSWKEYVSLAVSSKTHLYMMAQVPILAYGPTWAGVMAYASEFGFAAVVQAPDIHELKRIVIEMLNSKQDDILQAAAQVMGQNHNAEKVCSNLLAVCARIKDEREGLRN
ncbi:MAG: hypothetical protein KAQ69_07215 [Spirochaetales bacterium]|nr:hypothetical protein [Spirochaetales bacterium]